MTIHKQFCIEQYIKIAIFVFLKFANSQTFKKLLKFYIKIDKDLILQVYLVYHVEIKHFLHQFTKHDTVTYTIEEILFIFAKRWHKYNYKYK